MYQSQSLSVLADESYIRVSAQRRGAVDTGGLDFLTQNIPMPTKPADPLQLKKKPARPGHGGPRAGSGRPKDTGAPATRRSKKVADEIAEGKRFVEETEGPLPADATPLDVMLMAMRKAYLSGGSIAAAPYAEKCAPYIHARIANIELTGKNKGPVLLSFRWADEVTEDE